MKKNKVAVFIVLMALLMTIAAGCGEDEEEATTTEEITTEEETTEEVTEEEIVHEGVYNDLTGEWNTDREEEYGRPIAVMINNISDALPQCDVGKADIIYEMMVEGGITRLLAIYNDYSDLELLGSIRSCRPYYVTVAMEYDAIYLHYGQSPQGKTKLESTGIDNLSGLDAEGNVTYYRYSERVAPHNVFTNTEMILAGIEYCGYDTEHSAGFESVFTFNEEITELSSGETTNKITTPISSYTSPWFEYNSDDGLYYRFEYGDAQIDGNTGEQLAFENVIIQFAHYTSIDDHDRQELDQVGEGEGYYATNGTIIPITWKKGSESSITKYYNEDGEEITLNPGKTWITVMESDRADQVIWE